MLNLLTRIHQTLRRPQGALAKRVGALLGAFFVASAAAQTTPPTLQLTSTSYAVPENQGSIRIVVRRFGDVNSAVSVVLSASDVTAISGQDYVARTATLNFGTNETQRTLDFLILDNGATNVTKTFQVDLSSPGGGAVLGYPSSATVSILDDETGATGYSAGTFEFSSALYQSTDSEGDDDQGGTYLRGGDYLEESGPIITVVRKNGSRGRVLVDVRTFNTPFSNTNVYYPIPAGSTLVFDDYQMSASFVLPVKKYDQSTFLNDLFLNAQCITTNTNGNWFAISPSSFCTNANFSVWPFFVYFTNINDIANLQIETNSAGGTSFPQGLGTPISPMFHIGLEISNVRPDPDEDPAVVQPALGPQSTANARIVVVDNWKDNNGTILASTPGMGFSVERINWYTDETKHVYQIWVNRDASVGPDAVVHYWVNNANSGAPAGDHNNKSFALHAGADYATPFIDYLPPGSVEWWRATGTPEATTDADATIHWGPNEFGPKPAYVVINADDLVEFDEDMIFQLYLRQGELGTLAPGASRALLDVVHDNIYGFAVDTNGITGGEVTAGGLDREYNQEDSVNTDPPLNLRPGANNTVLAEALTADGKMVLGGEFTAYNTHPRKHIVRVLPDGQIDNNFKVGVGTDQAVTAIVVQPDGKTIIGGLFSSYNGTLANGVARLNFDGSLDSSFNSGLGANKPIRAVALLSDGKILIGGEFTSFNGTNRNYIARLNANGSLDTSFDTGAGPNDYVYSIATLSQPSFGVDLNSTLVDKAGQRIDVYDTGSRQGTLVLDYNFGTAGTIGVYYDGQLLQQTVRATGQGTLTIPYGPGSSSRVRIAVNEGLSIFNQNWSYHLGMVPVSDDRPIIGGRFTSVNGVLRNRIARLTSSGTLDPSFDPGFGAEDGVIYSVIKHGNKAYAGGTFTSFDRRYRNRIVGLNDDGSVDTEFDPGIGFNDIVYSLVMHPSGKLFAGGLFTEFNTSRRIGMARLRNDGKLDTTFMDTAYNQFAGIPTETSSQPENFIRAMTFDRITNVLTTQITVTNATDGSVTNVTLTFNHENDYLYVGGSFQQVGAPVNRRDTKLPRQNYARIVAGSTPGPGILSLSQETYSADENSGQVFVTADRDDGHLVAVTANFATRDLPQGPGAATEEADYLQTFTPSVSWKSARNFSRQLSEALRGPNNVEYFSSFQGGGTLFGESDLWVPILDDSLQEGDEQLEVTLSTRQHFVSLGGEPIPVWPALGRSSSRLTIVDNDFNPGVIGFSDAQYFVNENGLFATITLTRTNGAAGEVTVDYRTRTGGTASPWDPIARSGDYDPISIATVSFAAGQTNASFRVNLRDDTAAELDETVLLELRNPSAGATLGRSTATLTIIDNDFAPGRLSFSLPVFTVNEGDGFANILVKRAGGSVGSESVEVSTADVTGGLPAGVAGARAGIDYTAIAKYVLTWANGDTSDRTVKVPIADLVKVDGTRRFKVVLANPKVNGVSEPNALGNQRESFVDIIDNDAFGNLRFAQPQFVVDENGTNATITVIRAGGVAGDVSVNYGTLAVLAIPGEDYQPVSGTLTFAPGETAKSFVVPIIDDNVVDGTKTVTLTLSGQTNDISGTRTLGTLGAPAQVTLSIIDNELENIPAGSLDASFLAEGANEFIYSAALQPDGRILLGGDFTTVNSVTRNRLARLEEDGSLDASFFAGSGPNGSVRAMEIQDNGRILIAGSFTSVASTNRNSIARLTADGSVDPTFDPGAGANNPIYTLLLQPDGRVVIGGDFSAIGAVNRNGIARLNTNGVIDVSFDPGTGGAGAPGFTVYTLAQQLDGKILVGGDFTLFNNRAANHLVRLKADGSVDTSFDMSIGANGSVRSIAVQPDGRILIGGLFTSILGVPANHMARLNPDGTLDTSFNAATTVAAEKRGANGNVSAIAVQIDGKIVLGGDFTQFNGVTRGGITRLNSDGSNDPTINFGSGANGSVASLAVQPDRKIILAGGFTQYDGQPRLRLARINGGSIKGAGRLEFASAAYTVSETSTNGVITVHRVGGTASAVTVHYKTQPDLAVPADARAVPGVDYMDVEGNLTFAEGETQATFKVPVLDDTTVEGDKAFSIVLSNPAGQPGSDQPGLGDQPETRVVITSDDSEISFSAPAFSVGESIPSGSAAITVMRTGAISVPVSVNFFTKDGTATSGVDYQGTTNTITFAIGESQRTFSIPIIPDSLVEGNETVNLYLTNATKGGVFKAGGDKSVLTIVDDDFAPGEIRFERPNYSIREGNVIAEVTVIRTNGLTGVVTVDYATSAGSATPDSDYKDVSGILTFNDGVAVQTIKVQIFDDDFVENNETINLRLTNVRGGASLGLDSAILTIIDDDLGSGSLDTAFNPGTGANGPIRDIFMDPSRRLLIGGDFTAYNSDTNRSRITRLVLSGAADPTFKTNSGAANGPNGAVASIALQPDGRIVIGGVFNFIDGQQERRVARLLANGVLDTSFFLPLGLDGQVSSVAIQPADSKVIIGGVFSAASAANRNRIARLNANGQVDVSFDPGLGADNSVNTVALQSDGKILIGGAFNTVNGISAGRIARLNANGSVDTNFRTGTGFSRADGRQPMVYDILILANGQIMVAGDFTSYNGVPRAGIAVLDQNGVLQSFASGLGSVNGAIRAVAIQHTDLNNDDKVIIGGDFTFIDGTPRPRVARLDATGKFDPSFDPGDGADDSVLGIIVQPWDGRVIVVGAFTEFNNNPNLHGIARLNNDKKFLPTGNTDVTLGAVGVLGSDLTISFTGEAGASYMIESTADFNTWSDVKTVVGTGAATTTTVPVSGSAGFYRIRKL